MSVLHGFDVVFVVKISAINVRLSLPFAGMGNEGNVALAPPEKANFDFINQIFAIHFTHTGHSATSRKVAVPIPDGVAGNFH
jgi:hypothetical protein